MILLFTIKFIEDGIQNVLEMAEWRQLIAEWLSEYASLQENEVKSFAAEHEHNHEIATALFNLFYSEDEGDVNTSKRQNEASEEVPIS